MRIIADAGVMEFQHTAARRRLVTAADNPTHSSLFQHTAARRRLALFVFFRFISTLVSTHSRPKAAGKSPAMLCGSTIVSTHSRPKAAGLTRLCGYQSHQSFNTQPPEGGWDSTNIAAALERIVSTHSRPKAAGLSISLMTVP